MKTFKKLHSNGKEKDCSEEEGWQKEEDITSLVTFAKSPPMAGLLFFGE
jgi:hypothetical protein